MIGVLSGAKPLFRYYNLCRVGIRFFRYVYFCIVAVGSDIEVVAVCFCMQNPLVLELLMG